VNERDEQLQTALRVDPIITCSSSAGTSWARRRRRRTWRSARSICCGHARCFSRLFASRRDHLYLHPETGDLECIHCCEVNGKHEPECTMLFVFEALARASQRHEPRPATAYDVRQPSKERRAHAAGVDRSSRASGRAASVPMPAQARRRIYTRCQLCSVILGLDDDTARGLCIDCQQRPRPVGSDRTGAASRAGRCGDHAGRARVDVEPADAVGPVQKRPSPQRRNRHQAHAHILPPADLLRILNDRLRADVGSACRSGRSSSSTPKRRRCSKWSARRIGRGSADPAARAQHGVLEHITRR